MVPAGKRLRNRHSHKIRRPRVMRIVQQPTRSIRRPRRPIRFTSIMPHIVRAEALKARRVRVPQRARQQPHHCIDDHRRRKLAARKNIIPNRNLAVAQQLIHSLIHSFIPPADDDYSLYRRQLLGHGLSKRLPLRRQKNHGLLLPLPLGLRRNLQRLHRVINWLYFQNHPLAPAEGSVIYRSMAVVSEAPQVVHSNIDQSSRAGALQYSVVERTRKEVRKDRNDVEAHGWLLPCSGLMITL